MKRKLLLGLTALLAVSALSVGLVACRPTEDVDDGKLTVTFYDGETVLKEVEVDEGSTVTEYTPEKEGGYTFVDWFATPSFNHRFDFEEPITEDTSVFAGFSLYEEDTREFYIVGTGTSKYLLGQDWGKNLTDEHKLTRVEGKNEYTITTDLMEGDEFQFAINGLWHNKRGYGYLADNKLEDGTQVFNGTGGGLGEVTSKGQNIQVLHSGNYTLTLKTYPHEDFYNTDDPSYSDDQKEVYNFGLFDRIEWVRNGDPVDPPTVVVDYYIKGANITGWQDMWNNATKMTNTDGVYTLTVYLEQGEEFMFASTNTIGSVTSSGTASVLASALDDASKDLFTGERNMVAAKTGTYTFTYTEATGVLSATIDEATVPEARDYYLDGTFAGAWGDTLYGPEADRQPGPNGSSLFIDDYKLTETAQGSGIYQILGVELPAGAELIIQSYKAGAAEPGQWNTENYALLGTYNSTYLLPKLADTSDFGAVSATNKNILVKTAGTYNITFDSYSQMITINDGFDIYLKGGMNNWTHNYADEWRMTQNAENEMLYEITVEFTAGQEFGFAQYNKGEDAPELAASGGTFLNKTKAGTAEDTADFVPDEGTNFKASVSGTYRVVYDAEKDTIDFYKVTE